MSISNKYYTVYDWGGYCSAKYRFSNRKYHEGKCTKWQCRFWQSWYKHGLLGQMSKEFMSFDRAYEWLVHTSKDFTTYRIHCHDSYNWCWEKDGSGTHEFDSNMSFVPCNVNNYWREQDNPDFRNTQEIVSIDPLGCVRYWKSYSECEKYLNKGRTVDTMRDCCNMRYGRHTVSQGKLKGWSFYKKEDYHGIP